MGTTTLLDACRTYGIKRYHQVATDEVYGDRLQSQSSFAERNISKRPKGLRFNLFLNYKIRGTNEKIHSKGLR